MNHLLILHVRLDCRIRELKDCESALEFVRRGEKFERIRGDAGGWG